VKNIIALLRAIFCCISFSTTSKEIVEQNISPDILEKIYETVEELWKSNEKHYKDFFDHLNQGASGTLTQVEICETSPTSPSTSNSPKTEAAAAFFDSISLPNSTCETPYTLSPSSRSFGKLNSVVISTESNSFRESISFSPTTSIDSEFFLNQNILAKRQSIASRRPLKTLFVVLLPVIVEAEIEKDPQNKLLIEKQMHYKLKDICRKCIISYEDFKLVLLKAFKTSIKQLKLKKNWALCIKPIESTTKRIVELTNAWEKHSHLRTITSHSILNDTDLIQNICSIFLNIKQTLDANASNESLYQRTVSEKNCEYQFELQRKEGDRPLA